MVLKASRGVFSHMWKGVCFTFGSTRDVFVVSSPW